MKTLPHISIRFSDEASQLLSFPSFSQAYSVLRLFQLFTFQSRCASKSVNAICSEATGAQRVVPLWADQPSEANTRSFTSPQSTLIHSPLVFLLH